MTTTKRVAKNTGVLILSSILSKVMGLILIIYAARYLGDVNFGKYSFALAFTSIFMVLSNMGLRNLTVREVARDKELASKYLDNIFCIKLILSVITFGVIIIAINLMDYPYDTMMAVYIIGFTLILSSFSDFFNSIIRAFERMEYEAIAQIIASLVVLILGLFVLFSGYGLLEFVSIYVVGSTITFLFLLSIVIKKFAKPRFAIDLKFCGQTIKKALPFGLIGILGIIHFRIDIVMLSMMEGDAVVGWYSAAYRLTEPLAFIPAMLMISLYPVMSRFFISSENALKTSYEKSVKYLFCLGLPIAVGTTLLSDKIILLLYGEPFLNSIIAIQILVWATLFRFLNYPLGTVLVSINKERLSLFTGSVCVFMNITLNLLLIPKFSYVGASIATVVTEATLFLLSYYFISKYLCTLPVHKIAVKPSCACIIMGAFIFFFGSLSLVFLIPMAGILYFAVLHLTKFFSEDDISMLKELIKTDKNR
ncbi:MAG: flippase [Methanosarcinaceae archaeon]